MKDEFIKLLLIIWMSVMAYFMYEMWVDLGYMTDLVHAYIKMIMEYSRH